MNARPGVPGQDGYIDRLWEEVEALRRLVPERRAQRRDEADNSNKQKPASALDYMPTPAYIS